MPMNTLEEMLNTLYYFPQDVVTSAMGGRIPPLKDRKQVIKWGTRHLPKQPQGLDSSQIAFRRALGLPPVGSPAPSQGTLPPRSILNAQMAALPQPGQTAAPPPPMAQPPMAPPMAPQQMPPADPRTMPPQGGLPGLDRSGAIGQASNPAELAMRWRGVGGIGAPAGTAPGLANMPVRTPADVLSEISQQNFRQRQGMMNPSNPYMSAPNKDKLSAALGAQPMQDYQRSSTTRLPLLSSQQQEMLMQNRQAPPPPPPAGQAALLQQLAQSGGQMPIGTSSLTGDNGRFRLTGPLLESDEQRRARREALAPKLAAMREKMRTNKTARAEANIAAKLKGLKLSNPMMGAIAEQMNQSPQFAQQIGTQMMGGQQQQPNQAASMMSNPSLVRMYLISQGIPPEIVDQQISKMQFPGGPPAF